MRLAATKSEREARNRLFGLYRRTGLIHVFLRLRWWHANIPGIERLLPRRGRILDLGCGHGFIANYLALVSPEREVIGVDLSETRIRLADRGLPNVRFVRADVLQWSGGTADGILIADLLHHLNSHEEQEGVLRRAVALLRPGGTLVVKEIATRPRWKFCVTTAVDRVFYPQRDYLFLAEERVLALLRGMGMEAHTVRLDTFRPLSHVAYVSAGGR